MSNLQIYQEYLEIWALWDISPFLNVDSNIFKYRESQSKHTCGLELGWMLPI